MSTRFGHPQVRRFIGDSSANVAIIFALASATIVLAAAIAVNYSFAASTRLKMQAALDAAVVAGAEASQTQTHSAAITVAQNYFTNNLPSIGAASASFSFNTNGSLGGSATYSMPMLLGGVSGNTTLGIGVQATAAVPANPVCILLLSPSGNMLVNGGANINGPNCEIDNASTTANPGVTFNSGSDLNFKKDCYKGTNVLNNGGTHPNFQTGCTTASNPYVGKLPAPTSTTCSAGYQYGANFNGGTVNLSPGVYCGGINFNAAPTVTFQPGLYVIQGGTWNVDGGKWTGNGVTFYFADTSNIQFNSGMTLTLTAPTTGTYANILFYEKDGLANSPFVFDDSVSETMSGLIYLPSRNITFNGTSNETTPGVAVIANTATFDVVNWNLSPQSFYPITNSGGGGGSGAVHLTQ